MNVLPSLLELPDLGRVPRAHTVYQVAPLSAKVALALLDTEYGRHAGGATLAADVIGRVLRGWLESFTEIPRKVCYQLRAEYNEGEACEGDFEIALKARTSVLWHHVGPRLVQAEQLRGLGQTALVALARAADAGLPILLPQTLAVMAGDRKYLKERLESLPAWVLDPQPIERRSLEALANPRRTKFTGKLARAILQVEAAVAAAKDLKLPRAAGVLTAYPLIVSFEGSRDRWNTALMQITDNFRRGQDEDCLFRMVRRPAAGTAAELQWFLSSIASTAPILHAVDALLQVLTSKGKDDDG